MAEQAQYLKPDLPLFKLLNRAGIAQWKSAANHWSDNMRVRYIFFLLLGLIFIHNEDLLQAAQIDVYATEEYANIRLIGEIEKGDIVTDFNNECKGIIGIKY